MARADRIAVAAARGRVLAERVVAPETLPAFPRATMDGFAVRAAETFGASDAAPTYLRLAGEVTMGSVAAEPLRAGCAIRVHTGAMLPPGADGVVMLEHTNLHGDDVEIVRAIGVGEDTLAVGEDVRSGDEIFAPGRVLRGADLGALHGVGITTVVVVARPVVGIVSTGDEVVAPQERPPLGSVRDVNTVTLCATVEDAGGIARPYGIVADDEAALFARLREACDACDAVVVSAGSSVSARDITARAIARLGTPGILVHGIALRPGKPTILALAGDVPVIGLPGNPVSAVVVAWRLLRPLVRRLGGAQVGDDGLGDERAVTARLTRNVPSRPGREDYVPARLAPGADGALEATPVFGKSNLIFTLARADGLIVVPFDAAGLAARASVTVIPT